MSDAFYAIAISSRMLRRKSFLCCAPPVPLYGRTDGGLLNELGTFGFVWGEISKANALLPIGKGHVPWAPLIMSSTRSEIGGKFAAITHLRLVVEYYAITPTNTASCRIYCNSKVALARVGDKRHDGLGTTTRCRPHYDLKVATRTCLLQLPIPISWHWVKGHASARKRLVELTFPEILNETADKLATKARRSKKTHTYGR
jgi:hypothetical protein